MNYIDLEGNRVRAKQKRRSLQGVKFTTWGRDVVDCNSFEVEAGTTGYQGGDTGHGGRTYFRIEDTWGTDIIINVIKNKNSTLINNPAAARGVEIMLGGDAELTTFIEALKWAVSVLEAQSAEEGIR